MKRLTMLLIAVLLVGLLAACGGDDGDTEEPQELPTIAGGAESTPPDFNDDAPPIEATPPVSAPPGVSNAEGTAEARPGGLPFDPGSQVPGRPEGEQTQVPSAPFNPAPSDVDPVSDFGTLSEGDEVPVIGTVRSLENDSADNADTRFIIVDEQGNELDIEGLFFPMIASFDGREAVLNGTVGEVSEETGRVIYNATVATSPTGENDAPAFIPPGTGDVDDNAGASLPGAFAATQGEPLDINLGADLTALEAYDALTSELGAQLNDAAWLSVTGTRDLGWTFRFLDADQETIAYFVQPDGAVSVAKAIAGPNVPGFAGNPIDREQIVVDSDVAEAQLPAASGDTPLNLGSVSLQADGEGNIVWVIGGAEAETIDATTTQ